MRIRFPVALCSLVLGATLVACSGHHVELPFGIGSRNAAAVHQTGAWAVAASGDYQGHHWVRYAATATHRGVCYSLQLDGNEAFVLPSAAKQPTPSGANGLVAWCGLPRVTTQRRTAFIVQQRAATSTDFGYAAGLVPDGHTIAATFDDGSTQTVPIVRRAFTLFFGPGTTIVGLKTRDASGKLQLTCAVSKLAPAKGPPLLEAKC